MITPRFSCSQTESSIIISIYCPSIRAADVEINVDDTLFSIHINPYFLRLNFSASVLEDDDSGAQYDAGTGYLTVTLTKEVRGQHFQDLDLLAKLLAPRLNPRQPEIQVLSTELANDPDVDADLAASAEALSLEDRALLDAVDNDWQLPQQIPESESGIKIATTSTYGFLGLHSGYFTNVGYTENEVNELGADAETSTTGARRIARTTHEDAKWDAEHYMADFVDDEYIQDLIAWEHPHSVETQEFRYTELENATMLNLPRKEYLATQQQTRNLYLTLVTILFSYAYESRTTMHDPTPESAWTVCTLTPAFSALDPAPYGTQVPDLAATLNFSHVDITTSLVCSYRRSLAFPLYRSFSLAEACRKDVARFLSLGRRVVFRCLLELKDILDHHEVYYVYSKIWIDDFCGWIQVAASDEVLAQLAAAVQTAEVSKNSLGWKLEQLETAAEQFQTDGDRHSDSDDDSSSE